MSKRPEMSRRPAASRPSVIAYSADGTGVGKSLVANRTRHFLENAGVETVLVRIETRGIEPKLRPGDVFIPVESFSHASRLPGGVAGVLRPMFQPIIAAAQKRSGAVIIDWGGGLLQHHQEMLAATRFDERLAELGVDSCSFIVTTNSVAAMRQATVALTAIAKVAPRMPRGLVQNERLGDFKFEPASEQDRVFKDLRAAAQRCAVTITIPQILGDSWKICDDAGVTMPEAVNATAEQLAARIGVDQFLAQACASDIAAWWHKTEEELRHAFPFPQAAA
jgi:hypothetical protein